MGEVYGPSGKGPTGVIVWLSSTSVYVQYPCMDLLESVHMNSNVAFHSQSASCPSHDSLMNPFHLLTNLPNHDLFGASSISLINVS